MCAGFSVWKAEVQRGAPVEHGRNTGYADMNLVPRRAGTAPCIGRRP
jgi:hypothetical protein